MTTRYSRTADKALNEKNAAVLKSLLQRPGNKYCVDCKRKDPRWASWNLGIFMCIRCSGIHRSLGTHISKVKSVDLDTWIPDQVENMVKWGNERANKYWEANLKDKRPSEHNMEMWIRAKYEQKRWAMKGPIPDPSTLDGDNTEITQTAAPVAAKKPSASREQQNHSVKPKEAASLDDFFGSSSPASFSTAPKPANPPVTAQLQGADFFSTTPSSPVVAQESPKSKHDDIKSSILSLYGAKPSIPNNTGSYATNMTNYQQQLSGLSTGSPGGVIPQAPPAYDNIWGTFTSAPAVTQQPAQPQGSQFFSSMAASPSPPPKKPAYDAFADLLK
ncbi:uncharacterized protein BYT42DRAFT_550514 [Radiomyces spectabilis]|uniref:uncharacterized protein n=1 Tax=Radiomyces spectabilis TaxID=64574 RepID=UPI002220494E|nr:uncharacterized protein BYT42DRAFT_550514 [Radiomyces spectabilis]KAI8393278.1 hypothetical protein BYT42DRAFT_550514 [Radiomyces spectabilis]